MDRPTLEVADIFRRYGDTYRDQMGLSLSTAQRRVMAAIEQCRTAALGGHVEQCDACARQRIAYNSCANRHCPKCQSLARAAWVQQRTAEVLDCEYFHVVFTVPDAIAAIALQNKAVVYSLLFRATADTLRTIAADPRHLGAEIGFFAVLHTWGQTLMHHPHLHCVVPGGGLSLDGTCDPFVSSRRSPIPHDDHRSPLPHACDTRPRRVSVLVCLHRDHLVSRYTAARDDVAYAHVPPVSSTSTRMPRRQACAPHDALVEVTHHSISIGERPGSGLAQSIFCPPSRRTIAPLLSRSLAPRRRAKNALHSKNALH